MKTILVLLTLAVAALASGCATKSIEAGATKLNVSNPMGLSASIELPKNLEAEDLLVEVDPTTGTYRLSAKKLSTDAGTVIDRAGAAQAAAVGKLADTVSALAPLLIPPRASAPPRAPDWSIVTTPLGVAPAPETPPEPAQD